MFMREHRTKRCTAAAVSLLLLLTVGLLSAAFLISPAQAATSSLSLSAGAATNTSVKLSWTLHLIGGTLRGYWVEYGAVDSDTRYSKTVTGSTYTVMGLIPGTTYWFQIKANTTAGLVTSNTVTKKTTGAAPPPSAPSAPSGLVAMGESESSIRLEWTDTSTNETGFKIERASAESGPYTQIGEVGPAAGTVSYLVAGLGESTTCCFRVRAYNSGGDSAYSNTACATTFANTPIAPSGLTASATSPASIYLQWIDNSSDETGFRIERSSSPDGPFALLEVTGPGATGYSDEGLSELTTYCYRVCAVNAAGSSEFSDIASAATPASIPIAPSGLVATAVSTDRINLTWVDNSFNETGFKIERSPGAGGPFTQIHLSGPGQTSYSDVGLSASKTYFYRVRAANSAGDSAYSEIASATTHADVPSAPGSLIATAVSSSRIDLTWSDNSSDEAGFKIERGPTPLGPWTQIAAPPAGAITYSDTGLSASTTYHYRVRAWSAAGNSAYSGTASATTHGTAPAAPSNLTATAVSTDRIDLAWVDNSDNETAFKVVRTAPDSRVTTFILPPNAKSYSDTGLSASTTYSYQVCAINAIGSSAFTGSVSATTDAPPPMPPSAPEGLTAEAVSCSEIRLVWKDTAWNETGFIIESGAASNGPFATRAQLGANAETYLDQELTEGTTRYYRVCAVNDDGRTECAGAVGATTKLLAPTFLRVIDVSPTRVDLSWIDNSAREAHYVVQRSNTGLNGSWEILATLDANSTSYSDGDCLPKTTYYYRVYASGSVSDPSNVCRADTPDESVPEEPMNPRWLGKTPMVGEAYRLAMRGSYAYVASTTGLQVVDVSNKSNPLVKGSIDLTYPYDVATDERGYVYVGDEKTLKVVDVTTASRPSVVGTLEMSDYVLGLCAANGKVYVANYLSGLRVVDVSDPETPWLEGSLDTPGQAFSVSVSGDIAAVADGTSGVQVIDVSSPFAPTHVASYATADSANDVASAPGRVYVAARKAGLVVLDVTTPSSPSLVSQSPPRDSAVGVCVSGDRAYVASFSYVNSANGLQVFDLSGASPNELSFVPVPGRNQGGVAVSNGLACVAAGYGGLSVVDVGDLSRTEPVAVMPQTMQSVSVEVDSDYLYVLARSGICSSLYAYDASDPSFPEQIGALRMDSPTDIALTGSHAVIGDGKTIRIVSLANPRAPQVVSHLDMPDYVYGVSVWDGKAYVACYLAGLVIVDISNPASPFKLGALNTAGQAFATSIAGDICMVADGTGGVVAVDVRDPMAPVQLCVLPTADAANDVTVTTSGYAYVAARKAGLMVLDISNPAALVVVGSSCARDSALGVAVVNGRALVASFSYLNSANGLQVFDPSVLPLRESFFLPLYGGYCRSVTGQGRIVYLTDDEYQVRIAAH